MWTNWNVARWQRSWMKRMEQPVRLAALRAAAAKFYPFLPVRMWTPAARLAELVASERGMTGVASGRGNPILPEAHFRFRDGGNRTPGSRQRAWDSGARSSTQQADVRAGSSQYGSVHSTPMNAGPIDIDGTGR